MHGAAQSAVARSRGVHCPAHLSHLRGHLRQSKVQHLDQPIRSDHDVFGLDVTMHDAGLVRGGERRRHLPDQVQRLAEREAAIQEDVP